MANEPKQHHTRSAAESQIFVALKDSDGTIRHDLQTTNQDPLQIKQDEEDMGKPGSTKATQQQPPDMEAMLERLLLKQHQILEENKQLRQEIALQQSNINYLHQTITTIRHSQVHPQTDTTKKSSSTSSRGDETAYGLKEQTTKQLQSKRIKQLLESKPFSGSTSQEVSDWIEEFEDKCDDMHLDDDQRLSIAVGLLADNAKLWYDTQRDFIKDWETLKTKLSTYFKLITGTDQFELEQKLHNRRRRNDEPAIDYCHQTLKLCSKVNRDMDELTRIKHLNKGLDAQTQLHMDLKNPGTTEEFLQALIKYEKWQQEKNNNNNNNKGIQQVIVERISSIEHQNNRLCYNIKTVG